MQLELGNARRNVSNTDDALLRKFIYGPGIDEPICLIDKAIGSAVYYYHFDGLGSVVALSDVNNVLVERYAYDVFGRPTIRDANGTEIAESALANPYLFTGRAWDAETALYYYRARYYDYFTGRFLQPDPTGYADGLNLYSYCGNNPLTFIDPLGLAVGAPGFWGSMVPFYGSGRAAINDFQTGHYVWGTINAAFVVSDFFLVKSVATMVSKGIWKTGAHTWKGVTRSWLGRRGYATAGQHVHHGLVPQRVFRSTWWEKIFNQPWNLKPLRPSAGISMHKWHNMIEGITPGLNLAERVWYGTPDWFRYAMISGVGRIINLFGHNGDKNVCNK